MNAPQRPKRRHHHVWQNYLRPWTTDGGLFCLQDHRVFPSGTRVLAVQNDLRITLMFHSSRATSRRSTLRALALFRRIGCRSTTPSRRPRHLLMADIDEEPIFPATGLRAEQATTLNSMVVRTAHKQVFARSAACLDPYVDDG